jgi:hypothetical protein
LCSLVVCFIDRMTTELVIRVVVQAAEAFVVASDLADDPGVQEASAMEDRTDLEDAAGVGTE